MVKGWRRYTYWPWPNLAVITIGIFLLGILGQHSKWWLCLVLWLLTVLALWCYKKLEESMVRNRKQ